jgi:prepilin-type processing-associated H-X9-DG protein
MIFHCPSDTFTTTSTLEAYYADDEKKILKSYGWNGVGTNASASWAAGMGYILGSTSTEYGGCAKLSNTAPDTIVVTDAAKGGSVPYGLVYPSVAVGYCPDPLHGGGSNFMFIDGHAEKLSYSFFSQYKIPAVSKLWTRRRDSDGYVK